MYATSIYTMQYSSALLNTRLFRVQIWSMRTSFFKTELKLWYHASNTTSHLLKVSDFASDGNIKNHKAGQKSQCRHGLGLEFQQPHQDI